MARKLGTNSIAHGCTAAGNDQVRFEVALRTLAPELEVIAPVRDKAFKRQEELDYLKARKLPVPPYGAAYSINRGLWGVTIGGKETLTSEGSIPGFRLGAVARTRSTNPQRAGETHDPLREGPPGRHRRQDAVRRSSVVEQLETLGAPYGIGRGIHLGDTIIGTKGRVAFEAPAAETLLTAHRELEKLVLTPRQQRIKESLAGPTATGCTKASCSIRCAATSRRCSCRRRSASPARSTCCSARVVCSSRASSRRTR